MPQSRAFAPSYPNIGTSRHLQKPVSPRMAIQIPVKTTRPLYSPSSTRLAALHISNICSPRVIAPVVQLCIRPASLLSKWPCPRVFALQRLQDLQDLHWYWPAQLLWEDRPEVTTSHRHRGIRPDQLEFDLGLACAGELLGMRGEIVAEVYLVEGIVGDVQYDFWGRLRRVVLAIVWLSY